MQVTIVEAETGRIVATYPVVVGALNYAPSKGEYIAEAWRCALEDRLVEPNSQSKYNFIIAS